MIGSGAVCGNHAIHLRWHQHPGFLLCWLQLSVEGRGGPGPNAQPTHWLAKYAAECLRRTLLDDLGFRKVSCLICRVVVV
ncbi:hypothetical protein GB937_010259 [Aspergillus fischeri]|nr:hypothetical protein GB937_010259 [Aspergillus fischeri]